MSPRRPLFAAILLVLTVVGSGMMPAVHWASHAMHASNRAAGDEGQTVASATSRVHASDACPECAHLQATHATGPDTVPFYAGVVGLERAVPPPADPAVFHDVAVPEGRGPPSLG